MAQQCKSRVVVTTCSSPLFRLSCAINPIYSVVYTSRIRDYFVQLNEMKPAAKAFLQLFNIRFVQKRDKKRKKPVDWRSNWTLFFGIEGFFSLYCTNLFITHRALNWIQGNSIGWWIGFTLCRFIWICHRKLLGSHRNWWKIDSLFGVENRPLINSTDHHVKDFIWFLIYMCVFFYWFHIWKRLADSLTIYFFFAVYLSLESDSSSDEVRKNGFLFLWKIYLFASIWIKESRWLKSA